MSQEIRRGTNESICLHDTSQDLVSCGLPAAQREPNARLARPELTLEVATRRRIHCCVLAIVSRWVKGGMLTRRDVLN
jgi:hypothetical protein